MTQFKLPGPLLRGLERYIAVRERQARAIVSRTLLSYDDETLTSHGYKRSDLIREAAGWNGY